MIVVWLLVLGICLYVLSKSADYFTDAAEKIGKLLKLSSFVTGILIVALGTSLPELATSIFGMLNGEAGILAGNATGSNVANIFLGLGLVVALSRKTAKFCWNSMPTDMPFLLGSTILLVLTVIDGEFKFYEAIIFLSTYVVYVFYSLRIRKTVPKHAIEDLEEEIKKREKREIDKQFPNKDKRMILKLIITFVVSLTFIILSAKYTVQSLIQIALVLGLGTSALSASLVAIGTSLPEISVALSSAKKGDFDMVLGNITGSNIFNILVIFGIVGLFTTIPVDNVVLYLIIPMVGAATIIQWLVTMDKKITVTEGLLMTILYITFIGKLFNMF